jgi:glycosyltransferase involved in cell wall biosynthesis
MKVLLATAIYPTEDKPAFGSFVKCQERFLRGAGIEVDVLVLRGSNRKLIYLKGIYELRQRLEGVSLVHAHYAYVGFVARTQWKVPVVVTYHGDDALGTYTEAGAISRKSRIIAAGCRNLARCCDAVIVQSAQMAARFTCGNVHIIPHEVDLDLFRPTERNIARAELNLSPDRRYILFAADPAVAVKRFSLAQAAVELLRRGRPDVELIVLHKATQERLAMYMSACDALVFSSYQEGSPNIIKQAMACNLPIVATDVGDVREVIGRTEGCYICPAAAEPFAQRLESIVDSPFRTEGRHAVQHLSGPIVAQRILRLYEEVLRRPGARSLSPQEL